MNNSIFKEQLNGGQYLLEWGGGLKEANGMRRIKLKKGFINCFKVIINQVKSEFKK